MDRIQFSNRINLQGEIFADLLVQFFNQEMLLYNMVDTINDIKVINNDTNHISFELYYNNQDDISNLYHKINSTPEMTIYGKNYLVSCDPLENKSIIINIDG